MDAMEGSVEGGMVEGDMRAIEDHSGLEERGNKHGRSSTRRVCFIDLICSVRNPRVLPKMETRPTDQSRDIGQDRERI